MPTRVRILAAWGLLALPLSVLAETLPAGTKLQITLQTAVSSASKAGDKVDAVVIAPVVVDNRVYVPAGSRLTGVVKAAAIAKLDARAELALDFTELVLPPAAKKPLAVRVSEVDNARESVNEDGTILGILETETLTAQMDQGLERLGKKYAGFAGLLRTVKSAVLQKADTEIKYEPGVELELSLTQPLDLGDEHPYVDLQQVGPSEEINALVNALPFQTTAEKPPKPSDLTNLMYLGSRDQVIAAFAAAGWSTAEQVNAKSGLETFRAIAEQRGYKEAPMSTLVLEGKPPDMVFQKQLNTFAERHHLRIFGRPERFQGLEVWVCAATHDTGIEFSPQNRTFIHKIDGQIDRERAKVVFDLLHSGKVAAVELIERPAVPRSAFNATGDKIETDGKMAVLLLR
jgi:hypothetical protein